MRAVWAGCGPRPPPSPGRHRSTGFLQKRTKARAYYCVYYHNTDRFARGMGDSSVNNRLNLTACGAKMPAEATVRKRPDIRTNPTAPQREDTPPGIGRRVCLACVLSAARPLRRRGTLPVTAAPGPPRRSPPSGYPPPAGCRAGWPLPPAFPACFGYTA